MVDLQEHNGQIKYQITNGGKTTFSSLFKNNFSHKSSGMIFTHKI